MSGPKFDSELATLLERFADATPDQLAARALQHRIDVKYLVARSALAGLVRSLGAGYAAVRVATGALATYRNVYFDTPSFRCFDDHRRGRRGRRKVRIRHYPDRAMSFLEIKTKQTATVTLKQRRQLTYGAQALTVADQLFLDERTDLGPLVPAVGIDYRRITLLDMNVAERLTIDLDLVAYHDGQVRELGAFAVIELKRAQRGETAALRALRNAHIRERSLSKYCTAVVAIHGLRHNRLRPDLRNLEAYR